MARWMEKGLEVTHKTLEAAYEALNQAFKQQQKTPGSAGIAINTHQVVSGNQVARIAMPLRIEELHDKGFAPETDYLKLEQERIQQTQNLAVEKQNLNQFIAKTNEARQAVQSLTAQVCADKLETVADLSVEVAALREELVKASDSSSNTVLYAPISGKVQELSVNTEGGVVTEAQQLMLVVPDGERLVVEVFLENKDTGFVQEAMPAEIKVHTFPFTKYGVINGEVMTVSGDATVDEMRGLAFGMRFLMSKNTISVDGKDVNLMSGRAVIAEVQIGTRRIIDFFGER